MNNAFSLVVFKIIAFYFFASPPRLRLKALLGVNHKKVTKKEPGKPRLTGRAGITPRFPVGSLI